MARADLSCVTICGRMRLMWGARLMFMCAGHMEVWLCGASRRDGLSSFSTNLVLAPHPFSTPAFSSSCSLFPSSSTPRERVYLAASAVRKRGRGDRRVMTSQERFATHAQLEHLQQKYVGTGHADTTKFEWAVNQQRDSLALYVGFDSLAQYIAVAENESIARVKFNSLQKMIQPCGPPPPKEDE